MNSREARPGEIVIIQRRHGVWCVGIGRVSSGVIERGLVKRKSSGAATKAALDLNQQTGLLIVRLQAIA